MDFLLFPEDNDFRGAIDSNSIALQSAVIKRKQFIQRYQIAGRNHFEFDDDHNIQNFIRLPFEASGTGGGGSGQATQSVYVGNFNLSAVNVGSTSVQAVYLGSTLLWEPAGEVTVSSAAYARKYYVSVTPQAPGAFNTGAWRMTGWDQNGEINDEADPTINMTAGDILRLDINSTSSHPFWIKTANSTGTSNGVTDDTIISPVNQGKASGTIYFNPVNPGTYYYNCETHASMSGTIVVS